MPPPNTPKEVKQFLGMIGYCRKFVPRFADIARPLNALTRKDIDVEWTDVCQQSFELLKNKLLEAPILQYPDPSKPYVLFTDTSKYAWSCVLTQEYSHVIEGKEKKALHPIMYMSGLFKGSQLNWVCLTKEAYAIYMSVKKLTYYLEDADITLRSDHLPLKKFLAKNTLNPKVNNWAIETSLFRITFEYIKRIKNMLADKLSRLIDTQLETEPQGYEFGYYVFDPLPPMSVEEIEEQIIEMNVKQVSNENDVKIEFLPHDKLVELQGQDEQCTKLVKLLKENKMPPRKLYFLRKDVLCRIVKEDTFDYEVIVLPKTLIGHVLMEAHNNLGHNGIQHTYNLVHYLYYWKGMKNAITNHVKTCKKCQGQNRQIVKYLESHFDAMTFPMEFISMDLIGELHPPSSKGYKYVLTVICMLSGYVFCVPLYTKTGEYVIQAYIENVYAKFSGSFKILSDNGTEFKNKLFKQIAKELGVKYKKYINPYHSASNGLIEGFHVFLKACIAKHVSQQLEWDAVIPLTCEAYNFLPNEHTRESPFYIMFGRDPLLPLNTLLAPKCQYLGNDLNLLSLEAFKNMFEIAATNLKKAHNKRDPATPQLSTKLKEC